MKSRPIILLTILVAMVAWSSSAYAGCADARFSGTWEVVFSDGKSCSLVLNREGEVLTDPDRSPSTCLGPFRGETAPDSGTHAETDECDVEFNLLVEGIELQMYVGLLRPATPAPVHM